MKRDYSDSLRDILDAAEKAQRFVAGVTWQEFAENDEKTFAVIRALELIGEAARAVPADVRDRYPSIPWREVIGMRDKLIHQYFGVNLQRVWETVQSDLPALHDYIYAGLACKGMGEIALSHHDYKRALEVLREGVQRSRVPGHLQFWILNPLAGVIGTMPGSTPADVCRAAKIWGATEALLEKMGTLLSPVYRRQTDALISEARSRITPETFDAAWAEGRELSWDEAIALAMV